jgi:hypothetical protein
MTSIIKERRVHPLPHILTNVSPSRDAQLALSGDWVLAWFRLKGIGVRVPTLSEPVAGHT